MSIKIPKRPDEKLIRLIAVRRETCVLLGMSGKQVISRVRARDSYGTGVRKYVMRTRMVSTRNMPGRTWGS